MFAQSFRCLFLGDNSSWLKITESLAQSPLVSLSVQRASSSAAALNTLSTPSWDALVLDLHASDFQALDSIQKFRSQLPAFPVLVLLEPPAQDFADLATLALQAGASRCLSLHDLTAETMHQTILSLIRARKTPPHFAPTPISVSTSAQTPPIRLRAPKSFLMRSTICFV
jgi:DNA-binding NarL/FixJ family response regulator